MEIGWNDGQQYTLEHKVKKEDFVSRSFIINLISLYLGYEKYC